MTDCQGGCCLVIWMALQLDPEIELKRIGGGNPRIGQLGGLSRLP